MSTFAISDLHGCYNEFLYMLDKVSFSSSDQLILAGDYTDRGKQSYEMLKWIECAPGNVIFLRGNHEEELMIESKDYIIVHAGYTEELPSASFRFSTLEEFYLYAREESYQFGGKPNSIIIAGHTPTIAKETFAYNKGNVFRYRNEKMNCTFYDIDCGCVFRSREPDAKLACLRLDDEKIFYV